ncbi:helix-turn-helix domain-containing protein [Candidatus Uabimicrobium sp. HlEnr_7]|uniref:helix-turn-helix domain-containing protein n=1 Tax=Candidatus Uabimicrobium helgolandensis TaxID=3095367 RepID=UPI003558B5D0
MKYRNKGEIEHICLSIRLLRIQKGMSQEELGFKIGLKKSQVSKLERAKSLINTDLLISIAKILDVNPEMLFPKETGDGLNTKINELHLEISKALMS